MTHLLSMVGDEKDFLVVAHSVVVGSLFIYFSLSGGKPIGRKQQG